MSLGTLLGRETPGYSVLGGVLRKLCLWLTYRRQPGSPSKTSQEADVWGFPALTEPRPVSLGCVLPSSEFLS